MAVLTGYANTAELAVREPGQATFTTVNVAPSVPVFAQIAIGDDGTIAIAGHDNFDSTGRVLVRRPSTGEWLSRGLVFIPSNEDSEHGVAVTGDGTVTVIEQLTTTSPNDDPDLGSAWACTATTRAWTVTPDATESSALPVTNIGSPTTPQPICDPPLPPAVVANTAGDVVAATTWSSPSAGAHGQVHTLEHGGSWTTRQASAPGGQPAVAVNASGQWVVLRRLPAALATTGTAISAAWGPIGAGTTGTATVSDDDSVHQSNGQVVGIDDAGNATLMWQTYAPNGGDDYGRTLWSRTLRVGSGELSAPTMVGGPEAAHPPREDGFSGPDENNDPWMDPDVDVAGPGRALAIWRQLSNQNPDAPRRIAFATRPTAEANWSTMPGPFAAFTQEPDASVWNPHVALEPQGDGVAVWQTEQLNGPVLAAIWDTKPPVLSSLSISPRVREGEVVSVRAFASDHYGPTSVRWSFGDGSAPVIGASATHTYASAGERTVTVRLEDRVGNATEQTQEITVDSGLAPAPTGGKTEPVPPLTLDDLRITPNPFRFGRQASVDLTLSRGALVRFTVRRRVPGRLVGDQCLAAVAGRGVAADSRCRHWAIVGRYGSERAAGPTSDLLPRRVDGHRLVPGRYKLSAVAIAGIDRVPGGSVRFTILPRKQRRP